MKKILLGLTFLSVALVGAVKFTTYADSGVTPTVPVDINAMKGAESGTYSFDKAHSAIGFTVKHMGLIDRHVGRGKADLTAPPGSVGNHPADAVGVRKHLTGARHVALGNPLPDK